MNASFATNESNDKILSDSLIQQLRPLAGAMKGAVRLVVVTNLDVMGDPRQEQQALQMDQFAREVAAVAPDKIIVIHRSPRAGERYPLLTVASADGWEQSARATDTKAMKRSAWSSVAFAGVPLGHEFTSFTLALLHAGGHPSLVRPDQIARIRALVGRLDAGHARWTLTTVMSPSCSNCPAVVQALNDVAHEARSAPGGLECTRDLPGHLAQADPDGTRTPRINHLAVRGDWFVEEMRTRGILSVPTVFLQHKSNEVGPGKAVIGADLDEVLTQGRQTLDSLLSILEARADQAELPATALANNIDRGAVDCLEANGSSKPRGR